MEVEQDERDEVDQACGGGGPSRCARNGKHWERPRLGAERLRLDVRARDDGRLQLERQIRFLLHGEQLERQIGV